MCYEERYFSEWTRKAAQKREEVKSRTEHRGLDRLEPTTPKPAKPSEVERELEPA
jgi:hypothetical protein